MKGERMIEDEKDQTAEGTDEASSEAAAEGAGNPTVDEPTETSLEPHNDEGFRDGVPEPGQ
jgi:hypothetical protein